MLEALCRQSSTTFDIVHAEDGPPITQRTWGLGQSYTIEAVMSGEREYYDSMGALAGTAGLDF